MPQSGDKGRIRTKKRAEYTRQLAYIFLAPEVFLRSYTPSL